VATTEKAAANSSPQSKPLGYKPSAEEAKAMYYDMKLGRWVPASSGSGSGDRLRRSSGWHVHMRAAVHLNARAAAPPCHRSDFEEMCAQMYYRGKMFGFVHLYSGQEAVSTGEAPWRTLGRSASPGQGRAAC
jgi:hypothetical protein